MESGITARIVCGFTVLVIIPYLILAVVIAVVFMNYTASNLGSAAEDAMNVIGNQIKAEKVRLYKMSEKIQTGFGYPHGQPRIKRNRHWLCFGRNLSLQRFHRRGK